MKTSTYTSKMIPTVLALTFSALLFVVYLSSCNQSKVSHPISPTSAVTATDSSGAAVAKGKSTKRKDSVSSNVKPNIPPPGYCAGYKEGNRYVASYYQFNGVYLPEDVQKGKYLMFMTSNVSSDKFATIYQKHCFRRVVCGDGDVSALTSAGFDTSQLLIQIGYDGGCGFPYPSPGPGLFANWRSLVDKYKARVLGYIYDEPSGWTSGADMQNVAAYIHGYGSSLWLDDYNTGVIDQLLFPWHNCHIADFAMLQYGDYIMNDADNADPTNGWAGIGGDVRNFV